jgi:hypothetical protein
MFGKIIQRVSKSVYYVHCRRGRIALIIEASLDCGQTKLQKTYGSLAPAGGTFLVTR